MTRRVYALRSTLPDFQRGARVDRTRGTVSFRVWSERATRVELDLLARCRAAVPVLSRPSTGGCPRSRAPRRRDRRHRPPRTLHARRARASSGRRVRASARRPDGRRGLPDRSGRSPVRLLERAGRCARLARHCRGAQSARYIVITHAPPRPRLCWSATLAFGTWRLFAVPRSCQTSSVHCARPVAPSG